MDVNLHEYSKAPLVHLNFRYRVGAKHEKAGHTGLSHHVEHLLFQVRAEPGDFAVIAERMGAAGVGGNAEHDDTDFYETVPTSRLERMLWLESNLFAQFQANLTQENLDRQREVVINEKRQRTENVAYGRVNELAHQNAFPPGHPYQHEVGGRTGGGEKQRHSRTSGGVRNGTLCRGGDCADLGRGIADDGVPDAAGAHRRDQADRGDGGGAEVRRRRTGVLRAAGRSGEDRRAGPRSWTGAGSGGGVG